MRNRIRVQIDDYIDEVESGDHGITGSFTVDNVITSINLLSDSQFDLYTEEMFYNRFLPIIYDEDRDTVAEAVQASFARKWAAWIAENQHNFDRIAEALYTDYNPLYNYNKMQHTVNIRTGSETDSGSNNYGRSENTFTKTGTDQLQTAYGATSETFSKSGKETDTENYGATTDTLSKSGKETNTKNFGATTDTLTKAGKETNTKTFGATDKNTETTGSITDTHNIGQKTTTSSVATMDTNSYQPTGQVQEAARVDSDIKSYTNHNVEETEDQHIDTEERTFTGYQEQTSGSSHIDTEERTFTGYQEQTSGAARTDTKERTFTNYQEQTSGAARTDTATHSFNNYQEQNVAAAKTDTSSNTKTYNSVTDDFTDETKGNIGVMESVTMIESELRLRSRQIGLELLQKFYDTYTYNV